MAQDGVYEMAKNVFTKLNAFKRYLRSPQPDNFIQALVVLPPASKGNAILVAEPEPILAVTPTPSISLTEEIYSFAKTFMEYHKNLRKYLRSHPLTDTQIEKVEDGLDDHFDSLTRGQVVKLENEVVSVFHEENKPKKTPMAVSHKVLHTSKIKPLPPKGPIVKTSDQSKNDGKTKTAATSVNVQHPSVKKPTVTMPKIAVPVAKPMTITDAIKKTLPKSGYEVPGIVIKSPVPIILGLVARPKNIIATLNVPNAKKTAATVPPQTKESPSSKETTKPDQSADLKTTETQIEKPPLQRLSRPVSPTEKTSSKFLLTETPIKSASKRQVILPTKTSSKLQLTETPIHDPVPIQHALRQVSPPPTKTSSKPQLTETPIEAKPPTQHTTRQALPKASSKIKATTAPLNKTSTVHQLSKSKAVRLPTQNNPSKMPNLQRLALALQNRVTQNQQDDESHEDTSYDPDETHMADMNAPKVGDPNHEDDDDDDHDEDEASDDEHLKLGPKLRLGIYEIEEPETDALAAVVQNEFEHELHAARHHSDGDDDDDDTAPMKKKRAFVTPFPLLPEYDDDVQDAVDHELYENLALTNRSEL